MLTLSTIRSAVANRSQNKPVITFEVLSPLRQWLNQYNVQTANRAHLICQLIPAQCPFERDIRIANRIHLKIPPLCKLNPLYEEVVGLRFRALCYLAEACPADACRYC